MTHPFDKIAAKLRNRSAKLGENFSIQIMSMLENDPRTIVYSQVFGVLNARISPTEEEILTQLFHDTGHRL